MAFTTLSIFGLVILLGLLVGALYYGYKKGFFGSFTSGTNETQSPLQQEGQEQYGGKRNKKSKSLKSKSKSTTMTTTGVYLLLGAVLVGYIMSYF
jgi:hypothetical protein